nr:hypothetical protein [Lentibacillus daqui]
MEQVLHRLILVLQRKIFETQVLEKVIQKRKKPEIKWSKTNEISTKLQVYK